MSEDEKYGLAEWQTAMINLGLGRVVNPRFHYFNNPAPLRPTCRYCRSQVVETDHRCDWCGAPMLLGG